MKKTMLALFLASSCSVAMAQVTGDSTMNRNQNQTTGDSMMRTQSINSNWNNPPATNTTIQGNQHKLHQNTMTTTGDYNAYGATSATIPSSVHVYFDRDYPNAGEVNWRKKGDWYYATYNKMGRYNHVYYNERGDTYTVALPVIQNFVPDDIVMKAGNMFGDMIYDISTIKGQNGQNVYHIRTIEGEQLRSNWVGEDGSTITDPFRPADSLILQNSTNTDASINTNVTDTTTNMNEMNNTTDSLMHNNTDTSGTNQPGTIQNSGDNQDGTRNNNIPENQDETRDYAIIPQANELRKKS